MKELRQDPYEVLHLGRAATARDIGRAYRALVRTRHPDMRATGAVPAGPDARTQERQDLQETAQDDPAGARATAPGPQALWA